MCSFQQSGTAHRNDLVLRQFIDPKARVSTSTKADAHVEVVTT
jgi:hypothetical protein